jgi:hypothetical protein
MINDCSAVVLASCLSYRERVVSCACDSTRICSRHRYVLGCQAVDWARFTWSQTVARARQIRSKWTAEDRRARHATAIGLNEKQVRFPRILERDTGQRDSSEDL